MALFLKYNDGDTGGITHSTELDYYEYNNFTFPQGIGQPTSISNNTNMQNSGISASIKRINSNCRYSKFNLTGVSTKSRSYKGMFPNWQTDVLGAKDYSRISNYNQYEWPFILITPKHVIVANHCQCQDYACPVNINYGHGTNIIEFITPLAEGITAELDPDTYRPLDYATGVTFPQDQRPGFGGAAPVPNGGSDLAICSLKEPIPTAKIGGATGLRIMPLLGTAAANTNVGHGYPVGMIKAALTSQGIMTHSVMTEPMTGAVVGLNDVEDDDQGQYLTFLGDSSSPCLLESKQYGTVLTGIMMNGTEMTVSNEFKRLSTVRDGAAHAKGLSGIDEIVFADGGYTLNWVYADDWLRVQDMLTISTDSTYTGTTAMNGKEIVCEITATRPNIRGNDLTSTKSKSFNFGVSGGNPPDDGFTGEVGLSSLLAKNSLYEDTLLRFGKLGGNTAWFDSFPPVTAFANIAFGSTFGGVSGDTTITSFAKSLSDVVGSVSEYEFEIPIGVAGATIYASFQLQNVLGSTGDVTDFVELGRAITLGHGPTFTAGTFSWSDETPSPGDTIIGSVSGWTANPDRGQSSFQQTGVGFSMSPPTVNFTGPTFGITIPAEAEAGDRLIVSAVNYVNVYGSELALSIQQLTIS
jgi:hypothetical protein